MPDFTKLCSCEDGVGPNCEDCVKQLAKELAQCVDDAADTQALAEKCVRAMYGVPRRRADEVAAANALRTQLRALWHRVVGIEAKL